LAHALNYPRKALTASDPNYSNFLKPKPQQTSPAFASRKGCISRLGGEESLLYKINSVESKKFKRTLIINGQTYLILLNVNKDDKIKVTATESPF
jgi:hypothetical protein